MAFATILGFIKPVLHIIEIFFDSQYAEKHMQAGEARAIARNLQYQRLKINAIRAAAAAVKHDDDSVRDDSRNRD